tara:strand:+ start:99 stop:632 length:534 start_codon:yes stop_codon:yes gene_type:complete
MTTPMRSIVRIATKQEDEPYNILTVLGEDYSYYKKLSETKNNFYYWEAVNGVSWDENYGMKPENFFSIKTSEPPSHVDFDLVLCPNRNFYQFCKNFADFFHMSVVLLETAEASDELKAHPDYAAIAAIQGDVNVFYSEQCRQSWGQLGYVIEEEDESFCDSWNNVFSECCSLIYTRI